MSHAEFTVVRVCCVNMCVCVWRLFLEVVCVEPENNASLKAPSCSLLHISPITTVIPLSLSFPFIPLSPSPSPSPHPSVPLPHSQRSALTAAPFPLCMVILFPRRPPSTSLSGGGCETRGPLHSFPPASLLSGGRGNDGRNGGMEERRGGEREAERWSAPPQRLPVTALSGPSNAAEACCSVLHIQKDKREFVDGFRSFAL